MKQTSSETHCYNQKSKSKDTLVLYSYIHKKTWCYFYGTDESILITRKNCQKSHKYLCVAKDLKLENLFTSQH